MHHPDNSICKCYAQHISNLFESIFRILPFYIKLQTITYENSEKGDLLLNIVITKYRPSLNSKKM